MRLNKTHLGPRIQDINNIYHISLLYMLRECGTAVLHRGPNEPLFGFSRLHSGFGSNPSWEVLGSSSSLVLVLVKRSLVLALVWS